MACQHWGLRTRYVGKVGDDSAAALHRAEFARAGVEAHLLTAPGCASQQAFILVDDFGERTVLWKRDERLTLRPEELDRDWIVNSRALHVDGHDTAAATVEAAWARAAGIPVIVDLDELYPSVEALVKNVDYLIASRDIPGKLMADDDLQRSLPALRNRYGCALTAATLATKACSLGTERCSITRPPTVSNLWTPLAPEIFFTPDLFTACSRAGRSSANSISPARPPRSTAPPPAPVAASSPSKPSSASWPLAPATPLRTIFRDQTEVVARTGAAFG